VIRQVRFVVSGRVQGVFYRASTQRTAQQMGLSGWVRNRRNGDVELVALGAPDALARLEDWLWRGPDLARVETVRREEQPVTLAPGVFEVQPTA